MKHSQRLGERIVQCSAGRNLVHELASGLAWLLPPPGHVFVDEAVGIGQIVAATGEPVADHGRFGLANEQAARDSGLARGLEKALAPGLLVKAGVNEYASSFEPTLIGQPETFSVGAIVPFDRVEFFAGGSGNPRGIQNLTCGAEVDHKVKKSGLDRFYMVYKFAPTGNEIDFEVLSLSQGQSTTWKDGAPSAIA